jgi:hypothetical protein
LLLFGVSNVTADGCQGPYWCADGEGGCVPCGGWIPLSVKAHPEVLVTIIIALLGVIFVQYRRLSELTGAAKAPEKK